MKKYEVIKYFTDLQDNNRPYNVGETYPRDGYEPSLERVAELSGNDNKQGTPLIKAVVERKKSAEKIIVELRDKLKGQTKGSSVTATVIPAASSGKAEASAMGSVADDAIGALMVLDYREQEAAEAVAAAYEEGISLEALIKKALKIASGSKFS